MPGQMCNLYVYVIGWRLLTSLWLPPYSNPSTAFLCLLPTKVCLKNTSGGTPIVVVGLSLAPVVFASLFCNLRFRIHPRSESFDLDPLRIWMYSFRFAI